MKLPQNVNISQQAAPKWSFPAAQFLDFPAAQKWSFWKFPQTCVLRNGKWFLCWCLLQASYGKHFDSFSFKHIWWCFVLVPSTGKLWQAFWFFLIQKYLMMFCVGAFYRQALGKAVVWHHLSKTSKQLCPGLSLPPLLVNNFANVPPMVSSL